ncbi:MAG: SDR family oxidoreductase [Clostridia bacterium]|nr:SDR family oxidoreductase [Clostridia bacterium]MBT7122510.1 SDR family oxidoreductase [Clostridia bacterium]
MELGLVGKSCLVTGGAQGLGRAICLGLAKEGVNVAVNYKSSETKAMELAELVEREYSVKAVAIGGDVSSEHDVGNMFDVAVKGLGGLDLLVNNAGVCPTSFVVDMSLQIWSDVMATNLTGTFLACRQMARYLIGEGKPGKIVNICSQTAMNGSKSGKSHYAASKGGMLTFTNSFAKEVAKHDIAVNAVSPGMMFTEMNSDKPGSELEEYNERIPIGRIATVEEVAAGVVFLCSSASSYMTGSNLDISGGMIGR